MTGRNVGLELYRILSLVDAHQYHLVGVQGFFNLPDKTWYETYVNLVVAGLSFSMTGLFQIGTLFLIRRPFRLQGFICFCLSIQFYTRLYAHIFAFFGVVDLTSDFTVRFPLTGQQSWFFTSHALMTVITPVLHAGMLSLSLSAYATADLALLILLAICEPNGPLVFSTFPGPGTNWMNAVMLYFFAGFFAVHGWRLNTIFTWLFVALICRAVYFCVNDDVMRRVRGDWQWLVQSFQLCFWRKSGRIKWTAGTPRCYVSPISYVAGVVALYAAKTVSLPQSLGRAVAFLAPKIYVLHFLDSSPITNWVRYFWLRVPERIRTPENCLRSAVLVSLQMAIIGFVLEMVKESVFAVVSGIIKYVKSAGRIGAQMVFARPQGKLKFAGLKYIGL
jgi:hypothetical protein